MSFESINEFLQQEAQDPTVQQQLQSASDRNTLVNLMVDLGQQKGYNFTPIEAENWLNSIAVQTHIQSDASGDLSEQELESVAGGIVHTGCMIGIFGCGGGKGFPFALK